jgi:hypothetical protein
MDNFITVLDFINNGNIPPINLNPVSQKQPDFMNPVVSLKRLSQDEIGRHVLGRSTASTSNYRPIDGGKLRIENYKNGRQAHNISAAFLKEGKTT